MKIVAIGKPYPADPTGEIQATIDKYSPCEQEDELENIAKIFIELNNPRTGILMSMLHYGYERARKTMAELEKLGIITKQPAGNYQISVELHQIEDIFKHNHQQKPLV